MSQERKKNSILHTLAELVTIFAFPFIVFALFSGIEQTRLLKDQIVSLDNQTEVLKDQVILSNHISLLQLADQATRWGDIYGGKRTSYSSLLIWENKIKDTEVKKAISSEIKNIKRIYRDNHGVMKYKVKNIKAICKRKTKPSPLPCPEGFEPSTGYDAENVFKHLGGDLWTERARAACLLKDIETAQYEGKVDRVELYDTLVNLMKEENESSLCVSKMALDTYASLTGYEIKDVFDFEGAIKHRNEKK